jgi:hypothetical protein
MSKFELVITLFAVAFVTVLVTGIFQLYHSAAASFNECADNIPSCQILNK